MSDYGHSAKQLRGATLVRRFAECLTAGTRHSLNFCRGSASDTRQSPRDRLPPRVHFAECWTLALGKVPATGCGHVAILPSAGLWHSANFQIFAECLCFSTRQSMLTCAGPFTECFGLNTRQSGEFFFFCSFFSIFSYKYNINIYKCRGHYRQL